MASICGYAEELFVPGQEVNESLCSICYQVKASPLSLPCKHSFCGSCLSVWTQNNASCPLCRKAVKCDLSDAKLEKDPVLMLKSTACSCGLIFQGTTEEYRSHFMYECRDGPHQKRVNCLVCPKTDGELLTLSCGHSYHIECTQMNKVFKVDCFYCVFRKDMIRDRSRNDGLR